MTQIERKIKIDVASNRLSPKWTYREMVGRIAWGLIFPLFSLSPRPLWRWRVFILRLFGAEIGKEVRIHPTVEIFIPWNLHIGEYAAVGDRVILYALGRIEIGARSTISQRAHLCAGTHDYRVLSMPLLKEAITVGTDVWICTEAYIGPSVVVEDGAVVGARAVVTSRVHSNSIVAGNPARVVGIRE